MINLIFSVVFHLPQGIACARQQCKIRMRLFKKRKTSDRLMSAHFCSRQLFYFEVSLYIISVYSIDSSPVLLSQVCFCLSHAIIIVQFQLCE